MAGDDDGESDKALEEAGSVPGGMALVVGDKEEEDDLGKTVAEDLLAQVTNLPMREAIVD